MSKVIEQTYIAWIIPNFIITETRREETPISPEFNPLDPSTYVWDEKAVAFSLVTIKSVTIDGTDFTAAPSLASETYWRHDAERLTIEDVTETLGTDSFMYRAMVANGLAQCIQVGGRHYPSNKSTDFIVPKIEPKDSSCSSQTPLLISSTSTTVQ